MTESEFAGLTVAGEVENPFGKTYGPHVKIVCKPAAPPSCDLVVMVKQARAFPPMLGDEPMCDWVEVARFNDMSDDFAHTNAHNRAIHERAKLLEGE